MLEALCSWAGTRGEVCKGMLEATVWEGRSQ